MALEGSDQVIKNLNKEILRIKKRTIKGVMKAGTLIKNTAVTLTPLDTGNLRGSAYVAPLLYRNRPSVEVGFKTEYALYVHENLESHHPVGQAKFLETSIVREQKNALNIIAQEAKI